MRLMLRKSLFKDKIQHYFKYVSTKFGKEFFLQQERQ